MNVTLKKLILKMYLKLYETKLFCLGIFFWSIQGHDFSVERMKCFILPISRARSRVLKEDTDIDVPFLSIQELDLRDSEDTKFLIFCGLCGRH